MHKMWAIISGLLRGNISVTLASKTEFRHQ